MQLTRRFTKSLGALLIVPAVACSGEEPEGGGNGAARPTDPPGRAAPAQPATDGGVTPVTDPADAGTAPPPPSDAGTAPPLPQCTSVTAFPTIVEQASAATPSISTWNDLGDATSIDQQGASVVLMSNTTLSRVLFARGFGFSVPAGAQIEGVVVEITRQTSADHTVDATVRLAKKTAASTTSLGDDQSRSGPWPVGPYYTATYGSVASRWGASLSATTVNAASFAVKLSVADFDLFGAEEAVVRIDAVKVTVHYCL